MRFNRIYGRSNNQRGQYIPGEEQGAAASRFWVGGPCEEDGREVWLVIDGHDMPGIVAKKPAAYRATHTSEALAYSHAEFLNKQQG